MPGKKISDYQVLEYKKRRQSRTQVAAAATVGISERSARRIEADRGLPSQEAQRHWRTRADQFEAVWEIELLPPDEYDYDGFVEWQTPNASMAHLL